MIYSNISTDDDQQPGFDNYRIEDDLDSGENASHSPGDDEDKGGAGHHFMSVFKSLIRIMVQPVEGWKHFRRERFSIEDIGSRCFFPLCGVAALSQFFSVVYNSQLSLRLIVTKALVAFVAYFLGYYVSLLFSRILLPGSMKDFVNTPFGKGFAMMMMATLALFHIIRMAVPVLEPVLIFLPLWTIYMICRGCRFIKMPADRQSYVTATLCVCILGAPWLVYWAFSELLHV